MTQNTRKLLGTILMIVLLVVYPLVAMGIYAGYFAESPWWFAVAYAAIVGLFWAVPAGLLIRWMVKP